MNNNNSTITTPSNYYGPTGQPTTPRSHKKLFILVAVAVVIIAIVSIILISVINSSSDDEDESPSLVITRENNPILELYATLDEEMTLEALQEAVSDFGINAEIFIEYGIGTISSSDYPNDSILFYIDREDPYAYEGEDGYGSSDAEGEENQSVNMLDTYQPNDNTYFFKYAHNITEDERIGIIYQDEDEEATYEVDNGFELYSFPSKKEAIEAYLSPDAKQTSWE